MPLPSDSLNKRPQGRPTKLRKGEDGRSLILDAARHLFRKDPALANQRNEVARAAGVTPALLCYYFPDHADMLEQATRPVVDDYMRGLRALLDGTDDDQAKLRGVVTLLLRANTRDPHIVDGYVDLVRRKPGGADQVGDLLEGYRALVDFIARTHANGSHEAGFFVFALWGMCRTLAQRAALPVDMLAGEEPSNRERKLVDLVFDLVAQRGAGLPVAMDRPVFRLDDEPAAGTA